MIIDTTPESIGHVLVIFRMIYFVSKVYCSNPSAGDNIVNIACLLKYQDTIQRNSSMFRIIRKADLALLALLCAVGILSMALSAHRLYAASSGDTVRITVAGKVYGEYSLREDQTIAISQNADGTVIDASEQDTDNTSDPDNRQYDEAPAMQNVIVIKDGSVHMEYASCRNQVCVNEGSISTGGRSIVCLPNRVVVEIVSRKGGYDAVSR